jgi:hypothetical protein
MMASVYKMDTTRRWKRLEETICYVISIFWNISPCSTFKINRRNGETLITVCFMPLSCLAYYSTLEMEGDIFFRNIR